MAKIKVGTILTLTTGCYSDYRDHGPFLVKRDFDQAEAVEAYKERWHIDHPDADDWDEPTNRGFIGWLNSEGYIEDIDGAQSWHVGDYDLEPDIWPEE